MTYFNWTPELDVKVDAMNDQHKILIDLMEDLYQLNDNDASKIQIQRKLDELGSYTRKHFRQEELYMDTINYEGRERHKIIHRQLLEELDKHTENFKNHHQLLNSDFFYFLRHWLTSHIKHIDIKYGNAAGEVAPVHASGM